MIGQFVRANKKLQRKFDEAFPGFHPRESYFDILTDRIQEDAAKRENAKILEVGGVDRPLLQKSEEYVYIGVDIDEKPQGLDVYDQFIAQSIEEPLAMKVDMVISKTLMEHVPDNKASVNVMYQCLNQGGSTHHYIPSKWHPYSICLRLVGHKLQNRLIGALRPEAADVTGYPAFFNNCTPGAMRKRFEEVGFTDIQVTAYYQARGYFSFFFPLYALILVYERVCKALNLQVLASGFIISATKQ
ncbi:MAG: methyltransferase domain-containing protein [Granulosicoccus sp.]